MTLFESLRETAQSLIGAYGDPLTLVKVSQGTYNPALGRVEEVDSPSTHSFSAVIESPRSEGQKINQFLELQAGDLILTVAQGALNVDIEPKDKIIIGEDSWLVIAVDPPHSQDSVVVRSIQIRRRDS